MLKRSLLIALAVFSLAQAAMAQDVCRRHVETIGGFSYCVPEGWAVTVREGQKYQIVHGPRGDQFTPNINFKDENYSGTLTDYVAASLKAIQEGTAKIGATSIKVLEQKSFTTANGAVGVRVAFRTEYRGLLIRTLQYYFNHKAGQKLIVTGTTLEAEQETLDPLFDGTVKSLQLNK